MSNESLKRKYENLSEELLNDILNRVPDEAAFVFRSTPYYAELEHQQVIWDEFLETLDAAAVEEYKSSVNEAFDHYKQLLEKYFWALGLTQTIEQCFQNDTASNRQGGSPSAIIDAENRLQQTCRQFIKGLRPENRGTGEQYLQLRKVSIDVGSAHCARHGMEVANRLLRRVGLTNDKSDIERTKICTV